MMFQIDVPTEFPSRKHKFDQKAASVSVVQWDGNVVYQAKIFRPYNSYRVTSHSIKKTGLLQRHYKVMTANLWSKYKKI